MGGSIGKIAFLRPPRAFALGGFFIFQVYALSANCNEDKVWIATWRLYRYWYYNPS